MSTNNMKVGDIVTINFRRKPETPLDEEFNSSLKGLFWIQTIWSDCLDEPQYNLFQVGQTTRKKIFLFEEDQLELVEDQELCQTLNDVGLL